MDDGMPLHPYKQQIIDFSEMYQFCQEFHTTPDIIKKWKENDPYEYKCFQMFFMGLAKKGKPQGETEDGRDTHRHTGKPE